MGDFSGILSGMGGEGGSIDLATLFQTMGFPIILGALLGCIVLAFYGYRILKFALVAIGAIGFGVLGNMILAPLALGAMGEVSTDFNLAVIIGLVCAAIGALLINFLYKLAIFVSGAAVGYYIGTFVYVWLAGRFTDVAFFAEEYAPIVVGAVCALLVGLLFLFLFKFVYILSTSVGGMVSAGYVLATSIVTVPNPVVTYVCLGLGLVVGIIALVHQFKTAED